MNNCLSDIRLSLKKIDYPFHSNFWLENQPLRKHKTKFQQPSKFQSWPKELPQHCLLSSRYISLTNVIQYILSSFLLNVHQKRLITRFLCSDGTATCYRCVRSVLKHLSVLHIGTYYNLLSSSRSFHDHMTITLSMTERLSMSSVPNSAHS